MGILKQHKTTSLFILIFILAGVMNLLTGTPYSFVNSLMFTLNFVVLAGLILFWAGTVRSRIPPTQIRIYLIVSEVFMLLYLLQRVFKYRVVANSAMAERYSLYAYSVPRLMLPTFLLAIAINLAFGNSRFSRRLEAGLLLSSAALSMISLTNDLHFLVYRPKVELDVFRGAGGTYSWGPVFYVIYTWMVLALMVSIGMLFLVMRKKNKKLLITLFSTIIIWLGYCLFYSLVYKRMDFPIMYQQAEFDCFTMVLLFECCLRSRLIPHNINYVGFFKNMKIPILITDTDLNSVHSTAMPVDVDKTELVLAKDGPFYHDEDTRLSGMKIRAGYTFWTNDEHELHEQRKRLAEANQLLSEENDLISVENKLKEQKARLEAQSLVNRMITNAISSRQMKIEQILDKTDPESDTFAASLGKVCVYNAYSKRKANLMLLEDSAVPKSNRELFLALAESCRFLRCCGIDAAAIGEEYSSFPLDTVNRLYDAFEELVETCLQVLSRMTVSILPNGIRIAMEVKEIPDLPSIGLPLNCKESDGILFLTINCEEEGGAA